MTAETWPSPADVLPHRPPMVLLDRVVSHEPARTVCAVDLTAASLFLDDDASVPAWVGVEYMAQCVAAHAGLVARARGEEVRLGLLIGARRIEFYADRFALGQTLLITAVHAWGEREMASFGCSVSDATSSRLLADGVVSVYAPPDDMLSGLGT